MRLSSLVLLLGAVACGPAIYVAPTPAFSVGEPQAVAIARNFARSQGLNPGGVRRAFVVAGSWRVELNLLPPTCGEEWVRVDGFDGHVIEAHPRSWACVAPPPPPPIVRPIVPLVPQGEAIAIAQQFARRQGFNPGWAERVFAVGQAWRIELPLLRPTCGDEWFMVAMHGGQVLEAHPRSWGCFGQRPPPPPLPPNAHPVAPVGPPPQGHGVVPVGPPPGQHAVEPVGPPPGQHEVEPVGPPPPGQHEVVPVQ